MPTRTTTLELCDICYAGERSREVEATDHLTFSWGGRQFLLLACERHAAPIKEEFDGWTAVATQVGADRGARGTARPGRATLYSQLSDQEKSRFRAWAGMPNARRISDERVRKWEKAGKP